ncbi:Qa-SNARE 2 [Giardia muris]|uniref:Qa-SNARE 2 n=1 Tax=Giardia muris TaxID=5742 RepID=A0A4Z1SP47_GIAMU|nr:Qa-SNARE 2 [Giardia muris]|eukprot:TNJ26635.1 Qa-SNARE 2 [Giardia muris]
MILDLTREFLEYRSKAPHGRLGSGEDPECGGVRLDRATTAPWVKVAENLRSEIIEVSRLLGRIEDKERARLHSLFDCVLGDEIQAMLREATGRLEGLRSQIVGLSTLEVTREAEQLRRGTVCSLLAQLRAETDRLRQLQVKYVGVISEATTEQKEEASVRDPEMEGRLQAVRDEAQLRQGEIREITNGISELSAIIDKIADLMLEQGTIVDRIDQNLYDAADYATEAADQLVSVEGKHRKLGRCRTAIYAIIGFNYGLLILYYILNVF